MVMRLHPVHLVVRVYQDVVGVKYQATTATIKMSLFYFLPPPPPPHPFPFLFFSFLFFFLSPFLGGGGV